MNNSKKSIAKFLILTMCIVGIGQGMSGIETSFAGAVQNPKDIIIAQPGLTYKTSGSNVSILGASDYDFPLYMNGKEVTRTESGYFAEYVPLKTGANAFVFTNNGKTKTVTITKTAPSGSGGSSVADKLTIWASNGPAKYGVITRHNTSHLAYIDGNKKEGGLLLPVAEGTAFQIIGETKDAYCLPDKTLVFKSAVKVSDGRLSLNKPVKMIVAANRQANSVEIKIQSNINPYYDIKMEAGRAILTLYGTIGAVSPQIEKNNLIKSIAPISVDSSNVMRYEIKFEDNAVINGTYVEFSQGTAAVNDSSAQKVMTIGFKQAPNLAKGSLAGARILLDAGHGGSDGGAAGPMSAFGPTEKHINLAVTLAAEGYLKAAGAEVIMIRTDDTAKALSDRSTIMATLKPDLSMAIHCNSMPVTADYNRPTGLLTFYSFDLGKKAAVEINNAVTKAVGMSTATPRFQDLAMTRNTGCPSILFESAFMSNPRDYEWLVKPENQQSLGRAMGAAAESYIKNIAEQGTASGTGAIGYKVIVDGKELETSQPPVIESSRVLVPMRAIFEALGAVVDWNEAAGTVTATKDDTRVLLTIGSDQMNVISKGQEQALTLDVPARIINGSTMIPVRAVSEAMNAEVLWDNVNTVTINVKK